MISLKAYLATRIGKPAPSLSLEEWAEQIADGYIKELEDGVGWAETIVDLEYAGGHNDCLTKVLNFLKGETKP